LNIRKPINIAAARIAAEIGMQLSSRGRRRMITIATEWRVKYKAAVTRL